LQLDSQAPSNISFSQIVTVTTIDKWCVVSGAGLDILQGPLFIFVFPLSMTKLATKCRMDWNKKALLAGGAAAATLAVLWYLRKAS